MSGFKEYYHKYLGEFSATGTNEDVLHALRCWADDEDLDQFKIFDDFWDWLRDVTVEDPRSHSQEFRDAFYASAQFYWKCSEDNAQWYETLPNGDKVNIGSGEVVRS